MRFGVIGTHFWAREVHARAVQACPDADLVGIWGRNRERTAAVAETLGVASYEDFARLVNDVDALTFAVPPDVQAELALKAAEAGRHLMLEKPVATNVASARRLLDAAVSAEIATAVFVTAAYTPERRAWVAEMASSTWEGAQALWLAAAFAPESPFDTPWRHERGALWDIGPHLIAALEAVLGPVDTVVAAAAGEHGLVHTVFRHHGGATSATTMTLEATRRGARSEVTFWRRDEVCTLPNPPIDPVATLAGALGELVTAAAGSGKPTVDLAEGVRVVEILAQTEFLAANAC